MLSLISCTLYFEAFGSCPKAVASAIVMVLLTLNVYSATYFLAWAKDGSSCTVSSKPNGVFANKFPNDVKDGIKIAAVTLPFTFVPFTLCVSGIANEVKTRRGLGFTAGLILFEVGYVVCLGSLMVVCMVDISYKLALWIATVVVALIALMWRCLP
ncbi:hypothetical protein ACP70R_007767 [Stipagrostis hirtigluma subsp. patula]